MLQTILTRRSIRQFKDMPLSQQQIDSLLKAAFAAPSARNLQPWEFIVVTNPRKLCEMSDLAPGAKPMKQAALGIVVCANLDKNEALEYCEQDCAAATQNILLTAHALGLGGVWLGMHPTPGRSQRLKVIFGLPENIHPLWMIAIGYPDEEGQIKDKFNPEVIHYDQW